LDHVLLQAPFAEPRGKAHAQRLQAGRRRGEGVRFVDGEPAGAGPHQAVGAEDDRVLDSGDVSYVTEHPGRVVRSRFLTHRSSSPWGESVSSSCEELRLPCTKELMNEAAASGSSSLPMLFCWVSTGEASEVVWWRGE